MTSRDVEFISEQKFFLFVPDRTKRGEASKEIKHSRIRTMSCVGLTGQFDLIVCPSRESLAEFLRSREESDLLRMRFFVSEGHGPREIDRASILSF